MTFRFTDILRGLVAQPILWASGYHLGFGGATVFQKRNPHDLLKDFESELPCYLLADKVMTIAREAVSSAKQMPDNLVMVYQALSRENIVSEKELEVLHSWLDLMA